MMLDLDRKSFSAYRFSEKFDWNRLTFMTLELAAVEGTPLDFKDADRPSMSVACSFLPVSLDFEDTSVGLSSCRNSSQTESRNKELGTSSLADWINKKFLFQNSKTD